MPGKRLIADKGYNDEPELISTPNNFDHHQLKTFKKQARARQETLNRRMKRFKVLNERFHHKTENDMEFHQQVLFSCLVICQFEIKSFSPLIEVLERPLFRQQRRKDEVFF